MWRGERSRPTAATRLALCSCPRESSDTYADLFGRNGFHLKPESQAAGVLEPDKSYLYIIRPAEWAMIPKRTNGRKPPARPNSVGDLGGDRRRPRVTSPWADQLVDGILLNHVADPAGRAPQD